MLHRRRLTLVGGYRTLATRRLWQFVSACLVLATSLTACGTAVKTAAVKTTSGHSSSHAVAKVTMQDYPLPISLVELAQQYGFFKKNGLAVTRVQTATGPEAMNALASGSVDTMFQAPPVVFPLLARGQKFTVFGAWRSNYLAFVGQKGMSDSWPTSISQLRGKTLGVLALGGADQMVCNIALEAAGVPASDVKWVATGSPAGTNAALVNHSVAAVCDDGPPTPLNAQGFPTLFNFQQSGPATAKLPTLLQSVVNIPYNGLWARTSWLHSHESVAKRLVTALHETMTYALSHVTELASKFRKTSANIPQLTNAQFRSYVRAYLSEQNIAFPESAAKTWSSIWETAVGKKEGLVVPPVATWWQSNPYDGS